jgi:mannose-1-phosphate guanylyltransferase
MHLYPVIMAGGSGTRFWPLSRKNRPKQFLPLVSDRPLIFDTAARLPPLASLKETYVVCGKAHAATVAKVLKGMPANHLLVEPVARNTAPAIGLASVVIAHHDPNGIIVVLPSDQAVQNDRSFREALKKAAEVAQAGALVTLGIKPTRPEIGYGYIQVGDPLEGHPGVHRVKSFAEKPELPRAQQYFASKEYFWNAGIFLFRADVMLKEIQTHLPELATGLDALAKVVGTRRFTSTLNKVFPKLPSISIDYGVMEKAQNIAVVPADVGWSDVGSFGALPEVRGQHADAEGNITEGQTYLVGARNCVVLGKSARPLAVVGVEDLVVVDAGDAILVCPKDKSQEVRKIVEALDRAGKKKFL